MRPLATRICATCGEGSEDAADFCPHDGAPLVPGGFGEAEVARPDPRLGLELVGGIRIERLAAVGASGRLYLGHQRGVDRAVAVKILPRPPTTDHAGLEDFHREARLASRIAHPHVVTVLMTGELPAAAQEAAGEPFAVLEWLEGATLAAVLAAAGPAGGALDLVRSLRIALRMGEAVGEAHRAGVLHRDLKPENVMLVRRGEDADFVKVLDFGLAAPSRLDEGASGHRSRGIVGTPHYLAPEAIRGPATPASDVHAVAAVLFRMLSGHPPFPGTSAAAVLAARAAGEPADVRSHERASYVPPPLATFLARALALDPERRPRDGAAFSRDLFKAAAASGLAAEDVLGPGAAAAGRPLHVAPNQRTRPQDPRGTTASRARARRP